MEFLLNQEAAVNWEEEKRLKFLVITELAAKNTVRCVDPQPHRVSIQISYMTTCGQNLRLLSFKAECLILSYDYIWRTIIDKNIWGVWELASSIQA